MKKAELLAPAGNMEALIAAVQAGCDAVYLGLNSFSARIPVHQASSLHLLQKYLAN